MKGKAKIPSFSHERVQEALEYNPATGIFTWKIRISKNISPGTIAGGNAKGSGYPYIRLDNEEITCARLAIFYMTGEWPERRVRFKNGNKTDCRYENLTQFNGLAGKFDHKTREGRQAYQNAYRKLVPLIEKARALRDSFGISLEEYREMHDKQGGKCAICGNPETQKRSGKVKALAVDHNHSTGKIRELLCSDCNTGIGKLKDDINVLQSAIDYLRKHSPEYSEEYPGPTALSTGPAGSAQTIGRNLAQEERIEDGYDYVYRPD